MEWLETKDLKTHAFVQFIDESDADFTEARDESELQNMEKIKSKLSGRYDIELLFTGDRHPLLVRALSKMVIYDILRRNSARKVPEDVKEDYKEVMQWLNDVRDGKEKPIGLQEPLDEDGNSTVSPIYGNTTNTNNYI